MTIQQVLQCHPNLSALAKRAKLSYRTLLRLAHEGENPSEVTAGRLLKALREEQEERAQAIGSLEAMLEEKRLRRERSERQKHRKNTQRKRSG